MIYPDGAPAFTRRADYPGQGALIDAFSRPDLPAESEALRGLDLHLELEGTDELDLHFTDTGRVRFAGWLDEPGEAAVRVFGTSSSVVFASWCPSPTSWIGAAIDLDTRRAALVRSAVPAPGSEHSNLEHWAVGADIGPRSEAPGFPRIDLAPLRFLVDYGAIAYEQIYLSDSHMAWHGLRGVSTGLVDGERYTAFDLGANMRLTTFNESLEPQLVTLILDLDVGKAVGALFVYDMDNARTVEAPEVARVRVFDSPDARQLLAQTSRDQQ